MKKRLTHYILGVAVPIIMTVSGYGCGTYGGKIVRDPVVVFNTNGEQNKLVSPEEVERFMTGSASLINAAERVNQDDMRNKYAPQLKKAGINTSFWKKPRLEEKIITLNKTEGKSYADLFKENPLIYSIIANEYGQNGKIEDSKLEEYGGESRIKAGENVFRIHYAVVDSRFFSDSKSDKDKKSPYEDAVVLGVSLNGVGDIAQRRKIEDMTQEIYSYQKEDQLKATLIGVGMDIVKGVAVYNLYHIISKGGDTTIIHNGTHYNPNPVGGEVITN